MTDLPVLISVVQIYERIDLYIWQPLRPAVPWTSPR